MPKCNAIATTVFGILKNNRLGDKVFIAAATLMLFGCMDSGSGSENNQAATQIDPNALHSERFAVDHSYSALHLKAADRSQYGGFSALWLANDCSRMISFSDYSQVSFFSLDSKVKRSGWIEANLSFDTESRLQDLEVTAQGQLRDNDGNILSGAAESLAWDGKGFLVSFDDKGDLYRYGDHFGGSQPEGRLLNQTPMVEVIQNPLGKDNAGLESLTELSDGRVLALWEKSKGEKNDKQIPLALGQLIQINGQRQMFRYHAEANPGGATTLVDGSVVIAERQYLGPDQGVRLRLTRFHPNRIKPAEQVASVQTITPQVLMDHTSTRYDNFEGIASCQRHGKQWLFVLSDDNGDWPESWVEGKGRQRQKTLLVQFDLDKLLAQ